MAEHLSVFDIFKIGIGPSSSHTLGPWRAAQKLLTVLGNQGIELKDVNHVKCLFYGSLAKTGIGHGTDIAVMLGLMAADPVTFPVDQVATSIDAIKSDKKILFGGVNEIGFDYDEDILFLTSESLDFHPNGMTFLVDTDKTQISYTCYSIGGGFVVSEGEENAQTEIEEPAFPIDNADDVSSASIKTGMSISEISWENELSWRSENEVKSLLSDIKNVMKECIYRGAHVQGELPGGLKVQRRAYAMNKKLLGDNFQTYQDEQSWVEAIRRSPQTFQNTLDWLSTFALAVNEENASFGRVVTAPTNGAAGVIPAVLQFMRVFQNITEQQENDFIMTASIIGSIFKKGATISAAMGGCQAEIGVSSAMAAAGFTEVLGGTTKQVLAAAEIAMEHHLGLTCDPIGGLVQIPCIERNTMGAIKAITAGQLALQSNPYNSKVSLDTVVRTMWETALDMNSKYKETSDGGLATNIPLGLSEC